MKSRMIVAVALLLAALPVSAGDPAEKAADADMERAFQAAKRGYWQEAMAQYQQGLEQTPNNAEILNNLAVAHEAIGEFEQANQFYTRALELDPGDRRIRKNFMLFNEFYRTFVVREDEDSPTEEAGAEDAPAEADEAAETNETADADEPDGQKAVAAEGEEAEEGEEGDDD